MELRSMETSLENTIKSIYTTIEEDDDYIWPKMQKRGKRKQYKPKVRKSCKTPGKHTNLQDLQTTLWPRPPNMHKTIMGTTTNGIQPAHLLQ